MRVDDTHVDGSSELLDGVNRVGDGDDLSSLDLLSLDTSEKASHVVSGLSLQNITRTAHKGQQRADHRTRPREKVRTRSSSLWNISMPVRVVLVLIPAPTISISAPLRIVPRSTRPVTTVPRPGMEKTSKEAAKESGKVSQAGTRDKPGKETYPRRGGGRVCRGLARGRRARCHRRS